LLSQKDLLNDSKVINEFKIIKMKNRDVEQQQIKMQKRLNEYAIKMDILLKIINSLQLDI